MLSRVCVLCVLIHTWILVAFLCIFLSFIISLGLKLFFQTRHSVNILFTLLCPHSHFSPASLPAKLPKANVLCHQLSEVLRIVINLKPQDSISLENRASLREPSLCIIYFLLRSSNHIQIGKNFFLHHRTGVTFIYLLQCKRLF